MNNTGPEVFAALGSAIRHGLFRLLVHKPCSVGEIAAAMPVTRSAVSQHLKILKDAGLIRETRIGRRNLYAALPTSLQALSDHVNHLRRPGASAEVVRGMLARGGAERAVQAPADEVHDNIDAASENLAKFSPLVDPETIAIVSRLLLVARIIGALLARVAAEHGLSSGEAMILGTLRRLGEPFQATPTELSKVSIVAPPGVAKRLDRLEKLKLVARVSNPTDRRSHRVQLTAKGCKVADAITSENLERNCRAILHLPRRDKEQLTRTLRYIRTQLEGELG
jgi:DNA-binding MarR family transcriptional regulator